MNAPTDPSWTRLIDSLRATLTKVDRTTGSMQRATKRLNVAADLTDARTKFESLMHGAKHAELMDVHNTILLMEKYVRLNPRAGQHAAAVVQDSRTHIDKFQAACDAFEERCVILEREIRSKTDTQRRARSSPTTRRLNDMEEGGFPKEDERLMSAQVSQREQFERDLHEEVLRERSQEVKGILEDVQDINEIFGHINTLVGEQGQKLEQMETNVNDSERKTRQGLEYLEDAAERKRKARFWQLTVLFIVFVFVAIVVAVLTS